MCQSRRIMTTEHRRRIELLCRQIQIERDELQPGFAAKSKLDGNGHQAANNRSAVFASSYEKLVDDAVSVMRSDYASVQMLFPESGTGGQLRLLTFRGFN